MTLKIIQLTFFPCIFQHLLAHSRCQSKQLYARFYSCVLSITLLQILIQPSMFSIACDVNSEIPQVLPSFSFCNFSFFLEYFSSIFLPSFSTQKLFAFIQIVSFSFFFLNVFSQHCCSLHKKNKRLFESDQLPSASSVSIHFTPSQEVGRAEILKRTAS